MAKLGDCTFKILVNFRQWLTLRDAACSMLRDCCEKRDTRNHYDAEIKALNDMVDGQIGALSYGYMPTCAQSIPPGHPEHLDSPGRPTSDEIQQALEYWSYAKNVEKDDEAELLTPSRWLDAADEKRQWSKVVDALTGYRK